MHEKSKSFVDDMMFMNQPPFVLLYLILIRTLEFGCENPNSDLGSLEMVLEKFQV